ncbi:MAG: phage tail tape measure protein [Crocinitomicaceae bacterium]|nr:phage tail tape measure protein [Crocinitomicaceae bacterium]
MARAIEVPVVAKRGTLAKSIEGEAATAFRNLGRSSGAVAPLGRMLGKIRADADEFTKSIEASNARVIAFGASVGVINGISNAFKSLVATTINVEKKLTDINIVLGASQKGIAKFGDGLFKVAKNTAQSFDVVAEAATEFARQGLSIEETLKRTNDALVLTRLTGLKAAESVKGLTAAVNGFGKAGLTTTQIINKLSAVDVQFAVGTDDLIDALSRAGAVAQDAGVNFDELVALVTVAQQRTARGGAVIGNAFKTIYTRIQDPKALAALRQVGIAVDDITGAALPANKVLQNLAQSYDSLNRTQKASIDQFVAGKFQINILKSVLGDLNTVNNEYSRAQQVSANATDQAIQKNQQLNKTLAALATQGGLAVEELAKKIGDISLGPGMRNILTTFNELVEGATRGLDGEGAGSNFAKGLLRGIGGVLTGPGLIVIGGVFLKLFKDLSVFGVKSLKNLLGLNNASKQQAALQQGIGQLLATNVKFQQQIAAAEGNTARQAAIVNRFLAQEVVLREKAAAASARMAAGAYAGGFGVSAAGFITKGRGRRGAPSFAPTTGVPNFQHFETDAKGNKVFNVGQLMGSVSAGGEFSGTHKVSTFLSKAIRKGKKKMPVFGEHLKAFLDANNVKYISAQQGSHMSGFATPDSAKSFYKDVYNSKSPIPAVVNDEMMSKIYSRGLANMKEEAFAKDPVGAFNEAVNKHLPTTGSSVTSESRQAAALRSHYQRGAVEEGLKRKYGLTGFDHKNYMIDSVDRSGKPVEIKATMSRENSMSMISKHIRSNQKLYDFLGTTKDPVSGSAVKGGKQFREFLDTQMMGGTGPFGQMKPGTLEHGMFGTVSHRHGGGAQGGAAFRRAFRKFATPLFPNFSPIGDAVRREKMQVGGMLGISPSSVKTKVVQNTALRSPFNPGGFGVISPTIGQNNFADARRMHRGEDLRTANLPNFALRKSGSVIPRRGAGATFADDVTDYIMREAKVVITGIEDKASKKLGDSVGAATVKAVERSSGGTGAFGRTRGTPGPAVDPRSFTRRMRDRAGAAVTGTKAVGGAMMGPALTGMFLSEMAGGFFPEAGLEERVAMTPGQRRRQSFAGNLTQSAMMGAGVGYGAAQAARALGMGALRGGVIGVGSGLVTAGLGLYKAQTATSELTPAELGAGAQMEQDKASQDLQVAQQIQAGIREAGALPPAKRAEKIKRMMSLMGTISNPVIKKDLKGALESADPGAMDTVISNLIQRRSVAGSKLRARGAIISASQAGGFSESSLINAASALRQAGVTAEGPGSLAFAANKSLRQSSVGHGMLDRLDLAPGERDSFFNALDELGTKELNKLSEALKKATESTNALDKNMQNAVTGQVNRYQAFMDMRRGLTNAQIANASIQATGAGQARVRQVQDEMALGTMQRVGGTRSTIGMRFRMGMSEANITDQLARQNLGATSGGRFANLKIAENPKNEAMMRAFSSGLTTAAEKGDLSGITSAIDLMDFKAGTFGGKDLEMGVEDVKALEDFSKELINSAKLIKINTQNQKDYVKALQETAQTLDKQSMLVAGIEGFKNSLQSALQSIADPSMSGSKIGMNLLMGTLGAVNQQASANVADFVGGKLGNFFGLNKGQRGMYISGSRTGDKNPAMLEDGEYVLNRNAVKAMGGPASLDSINFGMFPRFQNGGVFGGVPSKHRRKALDKFGHASFGPSGGGSAAGGGGIGLNLGIFNPNLSSLAHASDPTLQATRGFLRQERQKDIQKQFQKQAERDQLVSTVVSTGINVGLSALMSGNLFKKKFTPDQSLIDTAAGYGHGDQSPGAADLPAPGFNQIPGPLSLTPFGGRQGTPMDPKFTGTASANRAIRASDQHFQLGKNLASGMSMNKAVAKSDAHGGRAGALMNTFRKAGIKPGDRAAMAQHMYNEALNVGGKYGVIPLPEHRGLGGLGVHQKFEQAIEKQVDDTVLQHLSEGMIGTAAGYGHGNQAPGKRMGHTNQGIINMLNKGKSLHDDIINQNKVRPVTPYEFRKNRKAPVKDKYGNVIIPYQRGGSIDNIPAMLTGGEFVVNAGAVRKYGSNMLNSMNRFQSGGMVGNQKFVPQEGSAKSSDASSSTNNNTVNIAVNMGATGPTISEDASGTNNDRQSNGRDLGRKIRHAVLQVIESEKRVGGKLRDPYAKP